MTSQLLTTSLLWPISLSVHAVTIKSFPELLIKTFYITWPTTTDEKTRYYYVNLPPTIGPPSSSTHYRSKLSVILWHSNFVNFMSLSVPRLPIYLHPPPFIADYIIKVCRYTFQILIKSQGYVTHTIPPTQNSPLLFHRMKIKSLGSKPDAGLWLKLNGREDQLSTTAQAEAVADEHIVTLPSHRHCHHLIHYPRNYTRRNSSHSPSWQWTRVSIM